MTVVELSRGQVIAHRLHVHGLVHRAAALTDLAVLDLGVQNSPPGALPVALSARLAEPLDADADLAAGGVLTLVWSHRGAPHLHRTADLPALAAACWPRDDADAAVRLAWQRARLAEVGGAARSAYRTVAEAVCAVLDHPMTKGELSSAVTARVPSVLSPLCRPCGTHHIGEQLLRLAGLPAGARLLPGSRPLLIEPIPGWVGPPADDDAGTAVLQSSYLHFFGPASETDVAGFLGTNRAAAAPYRLADLVPVRVEGRSGALPVELLDAVRSVDPPDDVRLLPPSDPLLQGRDRDVLVPDPAHRKVLWTAMAAPGALLAGVDVAGTWRATRRGRVLQVDVQEFRPLTAPERGALAHEVQRLGTVRGVAEVRIGAA